LSARAAASNSESATTSTVWRVPSRSVAKLLSDCLSSAVARPDWLLWLDKSPRPVAEGSRPPDQSRCHH
jgi:hypothetical protein